MKLFFDDPGFDGQLQRRVGKCDSGMANVGECLAIASTITAGDRDSWYAAWSGFADRLVQQADAALAAGHTISARDCYLRAFEYYRQAFFWHRDDLAGAELKTAYAASVKAFRVTGGASLAGAEGAEGHCEDMAQIVFSTAAFDWLDETLAERR